MNPRPFFIVGMLFICTTAFSSPPADQASTTLGKSIYEARCALCHGTNGKANSIAAPFIDPRPRDFTAGKFKFRSTETGSIPTDDDLLKTIREGLHGTSMPDWKDFISIDSAKAVIAYLKTFSPRFQNEQPKPVKTGAAVQSSPASIEAGKKMFVQMQCQSCHGTDGAGKEAIATDLRDDAGNEIKATNLTEPWTFRGGSTANDIYFRMKTGIDGSPMPSYEKSGSDKELWNLANYIVSIARKPVWEITADELKQHYEELDRQTKQNPVERGKTLVHIYGCGTCHSPYKEDGHLMEEFRYAGGSKWTAGPYGTFVAINLTSDKETGLGNWTDDEIKRGFTHGIRKDGSRSLPFPMPWTAMANLSETDQNAIIAYLRTIPPVYNKIPPPEPLNIFSYLWGKFKMLVMKEDFPSYLLPGNAGTSHEKSSASLSQASGKEAHQ